MKYNYNAIDFDTAIQVDNYPWGFKLRTSVRYWIETNKKGNRFIKQTLNPKTDKWCKPKMSTYSNVMVMTIEEKDNKTYVSYKAISNFSSIEEICLFENTHKDNLNNLQLKQICKLKSFYAVMENVEVSCKVITTDQEIEESNRKQDEALNVITNAANKLYNQCLIKNNL